MKLSESRLKELRRIESSLNKFAEEFQEIIDDLNGKEGEDGLEEYLIESIDSVHRALDEITDLTCVEG
jgi:vacuolar-type H+-ATPase subunit E/Vma4